MRPIVINLDDISDSTEVYDSKPNRFVVYTVYFVLIIITIALLWMTLSKIDIVVKSNGVFRGSEAIYEISSGVTGNVTETHVENGQYVNTGDVLYVLSIDELSDAITECQSNLEAAQNRLEILYAYEKSLDGDSTELEGLTANPYYTEFINRRNLLFANVDLNESNPAGQITLYQGNINSITDTILKYNEKIVMLNIAKQCIVARNNTFDPSDSYYYSMVSSYISSYEYMVRQYDNQINEYQRQIDEYWEQIKAAESSESGKARPLSIHRSALPADATVDGDDPSGTGAGDSNLSNSGVGGDNNSSNNGTAGNNSSNTGAGDDQSNTGAGGDDQSNTGTADDDQSNTGTAGDDPSNTGASGDDPSNNGSGGDDPSNNGTGGDDPSNTGTAGDIPYGTGSGGNVINIFQNVASSADADTLRRQRNALIDAMNSLMNEKEQALKNLELQQITTIETRISGYNDTILSLQSNLTSAELQLNAVNSVDNKTQETVAILTEKGNISAEALVYEDKVEECENYLRSYDIKNDNCIVKASTSGYFYCAQELKTGSYVQAGSTIGTIYPEAESKYFAEIYVENSDIAKIHEGQVVKFEIAAYPSSEYGYFEGTVENISRDISVDQATGYAYYIVKVSCENMTLIGKDGEEVSLMNGMACQAKIVVDEQNVLNYCLEKIDLID